MVILALLNSGGKTEARPTNVLQASISKDNDTADWLLGERKSSQSDGQENGTFLITPEDNDTVDWLEKLENHKTDSKEIATQRENSAGEENIKEEQSPANSLNARNANNPCIERYVYRIYYNYVFKVPICKKGCTPLHKIVAFSNGKQVAIPYDCYK